MPVAPRTAVLPLPKTSHAKPNRGPYCIHFKLSYSPGFFPEMPPVKNPLDTLPTPGTAVPANATEYLLVALGPPWSGLYDARLAVEHATLPGEPSVQNGW